MKLRNIQDGYGWFGHGKKLDKFVTQKDCSIVKDWKTSIINHMYWCASSTPVGGCSDAGKVELSSESPAEQEHRSR